MRVTVQIDRFFPHLVPRAKRIVAHDQAMTVKREFRVVLDARPSRRSGGAFWIVVSHDEMLVAV